MSKNSPTPDPLDALDTAPVFVTGKNKIESHFSDPAAQARIVSAHQRGVSFVTIAEILSDTCGSYISSKSVAAWIKARQRAA